MTTTTPTSYQIGTCTTCRCTDLSSSHDGLSPHTKATEPDSDGVWWLWPHHDWCPTWTGEQPEVACPQCGAPVLAYDFSPGVVLTVPQAVVLPGGHVTDGHLLGSMDEVFDHPGAASYSKREAAPDFDKVMVSPCGHQLQGGEGRAVLTAVGKVAAAQAEAEADVEIARHAGLLTAVEAAGHGRLADAYRAAVRRRPGEVSGLLAAMKALVP